MECCPDYWNGTGLGQLHETVEKRILEFCQNSTLSDGFIVAYAYRPIPSEVIKKVPLEPSTVPFYLELPAETETKMDKNPVFARILESELTTHSPKTDDDPNIFISHPTIRTVSSLATRNRIISKRSTTSMIDSGISETLTQEAFLKEVGKNQTFLGLASFFFPIKPV